MNKKLAIQTAQIRLMFSTSNITQITSVVLAAIFSYMLRAVIDSALVLGWFSLVVLIALSRTVLAISFGRSVAADNKATHFWLLSFRLGVLFSGIAWGSASLLLFPSGHIEHQAFIAAMLCGLSAGGLVSYSSDLPSGIVYIVSVLSPLIIRLFVTGDSLSVAMSIALLLYLGFMIMSLRFMNRNVTENIGLHLEAAEREQRYRLLLNHSPVGIMHYNSSLIITYCNERFANILHNSEERLVGLDMNTLKDQSILPSLRKVLEGGLGYYEGQYKATLSDANAWIAMTCAPSLDGEGKITGGVAIVQDITERKSAENQVIENEQRLLSILNVSPIAVRIAVKRGQQVVFFNPRYADLIKNTAATGDDPKKYYASAKEYEEILDEVERGNTIIDRQIKLRIPDGSTAWVLASYMPIQYQGEVAILGWFYDITQSKQVENALRESEEKLRSLYELSPLGIALTDMEGRYVEFNESFRRICGYRDDELKALDYWTLTPRKYEADEVRQLESLAKTGRYGPYEKEYVRKDGTLVPLCLNGLTMPGRDGQQYIWSIVEDITERKRAETALHESHQQMYSLLNSMAEGAYGVDVNGNCTFVNQSFLRILGYQQADEIIGKPIHQLIHHSHPDGSPYPEPECKMSNAYRHGREIHISDEVFWKKDNSAVPVEYWAQPILVDGVIQGAVATFIDITERKLAEAQIQNLAFHDALTQLPNRRLLNDRLSQTIAASKRNGRYGALMFLDLDNFKPLNDLHGHNVGDLLLIEVARRISNCIRETDTVARFGGDEFVVMLGELDEDKSESTTQAGLVAEKIRNTLAEPYLLTIQQEGRPESTVEHHCSASMGAVLFNSDSNRENILKSADMAMYRAKESGRNCVVVDYHDSSDAMAVDQTGRMLKLNWNDSYECGEPIIDQEHRELFELANTLIESAFARDENPQRFDSAMGELLAHAVQHFADEETILARHHYVDIDAHARAHKVLIEHALQLRDAAAAGGVTIGELVNFIANEVVAQHMLKTDRKFYPMFQEGRSSPAN